jgi:hypothetical protein
MHTEVRMSASARLRPARIARGLAVAGLLAATALTAACGAGQISQTADQVPAVNGNEGHAHNILLRDVRLDFPAAPGADQSYTNKKGGKAVLLFTAVNNDPDTPDTLTSITTDAGSVRITSPEGAGGNPVVPAGGTLVAGRAPSETPVAADTTAQANANPPIFVEIDNLSRDLVPGLTADVKFTFAHNGSLDLQVPIDAAQAPRQVSPKSPGAPK